MRLRMGRFRHLPWHAWDVEDIPDDHTATEWILTIAHPAHETESDVQRTVRQRLNTCNVTSQHPPTSASSSSLHAKCSERKTSSPPQGRYNTQHPLEWSRPLPSAAKAESTTSNRPSTADTLFGH